MRRMSFSKTTPQMRARTKTVTRRMGWKNLKPGERFMAIEKGMGLKKGEKQVEICECECVSNRREMLVKIDDADVIREGFPGMSSLEFIGMFIQLNGCKYWSEVQRIEFKYVEK